MSTPPPLPISNSQTTLPPSAFRSFLSRLTSSLRHSFSQRRPYSELIERTSFSRPDSLTDAASRIKKNYTYFRINYLSLLFFILAISLLSHPLSLLVLLALLSAWCFLYLFKVSENPLVLFGRGFSDREILGVLVVLTVVVVFLTSVGSILISGVLVGMGIVCVHGAFRMPEDLFLDEQEMMGNQGLLSFLGGAASSAAAAAAGPVVGTRV